MSESQQQSAAVPSTDAAEQNTSPETTLSNQNEEVEAVKTADPTDDEGKSQQPAATQPCGDNPTRSRSSSLESGEASPPREATDIASSSEPPLPNEAPPLPVEAPPSAADDGWDFHWSEEAQAYYFSNRLTGVTTWENPRQAPDSTAAAQSTHAQSASTATAAPPLPALDPDALPAGGYNPAIHGDYDPNAWYAQKPAAPEATATIPLLGGEADHAAMGSFNRFTGAWQAGGDDLSTRHNDENKSHRQMNAYFDVDAVASSHNGRSLKAERSGQKPSKTELKAFKEKRKARKEEKRRAWLRD
ncbi:Rho GTPase-activating protein 12/27 [Microdochium nivale]|nr:Rho GTPase-activating protein 12/27 [Microdochium nivale]